MPVMVTVVPTGSDVGESCETVGVLTVAPVTVNVRLLLVPLALVTVTLAAPKALGAGGAKVIVVSLTTVNPVGGVRIDDPTCTCDAPVKLVPVSVTTAGPNALTLDGDNVVMTGGPGGGADGSKPSMKVTPEALGSRYVATAGVSAQKLKKRP